VPRANPELTPPEPDLVEVAVPRELRGLWVATVSNLDWPTRRGLSANAMRKELVALVSGARQIGVNALVFQVRPEGDALYESKLEPWSRFLTGRQGRDPGFDPLEVLVEEAHAQGIEVHAWFNPYRASSSRSAPCADSHVSKWAQRHTRPWGSLLWLDPGAEEIRDHAAAVIEDVVKRYDIDGVHLDDYFYPYPEAGRSFPDSATYAKYCEEGGKLGLAAWRRNNVDTLVEQVYRLVTHHRPEDRFGISPFGIYRPGQPHGVRGLDQVTALNADPMTWYDKGWVDYLAPQLYWTTKREAQRYDKLLTWWDSKVERDRPLVVGLDVTKVGSSPEWTIEELRTQVRLAREAERTLGQIWFRASPVMKNHAGLGDMLEDLYREPALPPPTPRLIGRAVAPPRVAVGEDRITIDYPDRDALRSLVLYSPLGDGFRAERILGPATADLALPKGTWVLSAVTRGAVESPGVRFTIGEPEVAAAEPDDGVSAAQP
jgi:uncharacterized lipoprotein YddW (UPF0748 family)